MKIYYLSILLTSLFFFQCSHENSFEKRYMDTANGYSQVVEVKQGSVSTFYISGQISDAETKEEQIREVFLAVQTQLRKIDAAWKDVVKMNTYIVDYQPEDLQAFRDTRRELMGDEDMPASTLVGVGALALPEWKVEIEAVAVVKR